MMKLLRDLNGPQRVLAALVLAGLLGLPSWWGRWFTPRGVLDALLDAAGRLAPFGAGAGRPGFVPRLGLTPSAAVRPPPPSPAVPAFTAGTRPEPVGTSVRSASVAVPTPAPAPDATWGTDGPSELPIGEAFSPGWRLVSARPAAGGGILPREERVVTAADLPSLAAGDPAPLREALRTGFAPGSKIVGFAGQLLAYQVRPVGRPFLGAVVRARLPGAPAGAPAGPWEAWIYLALDGDGVRGAGEALAAAGGDGGVPLLAGDGLQLLVADVTPPRASPARPGIVHLVAPFISEVFLGGGSFHQTVREVTAAPVPVAASPSPVPGGAAAGLGTAVGVRPPAGALAALRAAFPDRGDAPERRTWSVGPAGTAVVEVVTAGKTALLRVAARDGAGSWRAFPVSPDPRIDGAAYAAFKVLNQVARNTLRVSGWPGPGEVEIEASGEVFDRPGVPAEARGKRVVYRYRLQVRPDGLTAGAPALPELLPPDAPGR